MAMSFEMHFGQDGTVVVDNIKGIPAGSSACLNLTSPYEKSLGVPVARTMTTNSSDLDINIQIEDNA